MRSEVPNTTSATTNDRPAITMKIKTGSITPLLARCTETPTPTLQDGKLKFAARQILIDLCVAPRQTLPHLDRRKWANRAGLALQSESVLAAPRENPGSALSEHGGFEQHLPEARR
jgi:hypothetical protein